MMKCYRRTLSKALSMLLFVLATSIAFPGCPAILLGGAAAGAAAYEFGELTTSRNITLNQSYHAAQAALDELGIVIVGREKDGLSALITGRGTENKKITIRLKKIFDDVTQIGIRVGYLGDELQSRFIFERMERHFELDYLSDENAVTPLLP